MTRYLTLIGGCLLAALHAGPAHAHGSADTADVNAIHALLATYTRSVSQSDRPAFEALLLDPSIPFHGLSDGRFTPRAGAGLGAVQNYAGFRKSVFDSGRQLRQRFYDVTIAHEGDLAQVSLRFETLVVDGGGGRGWKTLDLLRVGGQWKIASEFYTVYPIDAAVK